MIAIAVGLNILIALFGFYLAWRVWRLKTALGGVADALGRWEQNAHHSLDPEVLPPVILQGQRGTASLRYQYALLQLRLRQLQQVLVLVSFLPMAGRWARRLQHVRRSDLRRSNYTQGSGENHRLG